MQTNPIVSRKLKKLIKEKELTYPDLAKKIGISANSLTLKINGRRNWWFWETITIAQCFGFDDLREVFPEQYGAFLKQGRIREKKNIKIRDTSWEKDHFSSIA